jgi:hypothetical protein
MARYPWRFFRFHQGYQGYIGKFILRKKSKKPDDNTPYKNDPKDAKTIGWLVKEGRFLAGRTYRKEYTAS